MSKSLEQHPGPLISVVTVTRNLIEAGRGDQVLAALDSVQAQTFRNVEHVVWDGQSTDGTQELLEGAIQKIEKSGDLIPVRYFCEADKSLYDAMNQAVARCAGEYVLFLNSDDLIADADSLANVQKAIVPGKPDFVYGETVFFDDEGNRRHARRLTPKSILQRLPFGHNAMVLKRSLFLEMGGHDLQFQIAADYDMVLRMILSGHSGHRLQMPVSLFRIGGVSADTDAAGAEMAASWFKNYSQFCDMSRYTDEDRLGWYRQGHLPVRVSGAILMKSLSKPAIARAALYSLSKTLRRKAQFWRSY
ncbi:glycosyltransferase family 2 protein [Ruegeria sp. HKCCA5491]|uniref:glycosyltransferase family 2 protein n=1 Tax=Ruegeria sp. HKCCA5491 TaxID=2682986 RepID=UPI001488DA69|nr:glycosyltransferase family 2 protein [Ruegeria sp. HKCCA5491]